MHQVLRLLLVWFMRFQVSQKKTTRFLISFLIIIFCWFILTPRIFQFSQVMVASALYSWVILFAYFFLLFPIGALIYIWTRKMTLRKALKGDLRKLSKEDLRDLLKDLVKNWLLKWNTYYFPYSPIKWIKQRFVLCWSEYELLNSSISLATQLYNYINPTCFSLTASVIQLKR